MRNGKGVWKGHSGNNIYVGDWKWNRAEGYGTYTWPNGTNLLTELISYLGDRYDGEWVACKKQGKGADFFANGDTYVGDYKEGKPYG